MEDQGSKGPRGEVFTKTIRAGKRTYFFDVKTTRSEEFYLTITESKRRFDKDNEKFFYEKHKLFLYPEDFDKFTDAMDEAFAFIKTNNPEDFSEEEQEQKPGMDDVKFEDLDSEKDKTEQDDSKSNEDNEDKEE